MEKSARTIIVTVLSGLILGMGAGWIQINSRIAVLEVQVKSDHSTYIETSNKMDEMGSNINDIKQTLIEMQGEMKLKQDKKWTN